MAYTPATITVAYVNMPKDGKKKGSIKTSDDQLFSVWADKIGQFYVGQTYDIEYVSEDWQGKTYHTIKTATPRHTGQPPAASAPPPVAPKTNGNGSYKETSGKDAERMFVCSLLNAFIQAGKIDLRTDSVASAANAMRQAWQQTFGAQG